jgi:endonuclease/exonuclease/phosphatase family metal-dependent hydrolase
MYIGKASFPLVKVRPDQDTAVCCILETWKVDTLSRFTNEVFPIFIRLLPLVILLVSSCSSTPKSLEERTRILPVVAATQAPTEPQIHDSLTLISINLAHGRQSSINQLLVSKSKTYENLDDIAAFLLKYDADLVALQEADSPSPWSGNFHHVDYLAQQAGFPFYAYSEHARLWMGNYGTGILSRLPMASALGLTFPATPPTASKGFTLAQIEWPTDRGRVKLVDVISVHLDFSRKSARMQQLDELIAVLKARKGPLIIMGDFNSEWLAEQYLADSYSEQSRLHVYNAVSEDLSTYKDKRLDWILLTRDLEFDSYRVATEVLSDHRAIIAKIRFKAAAGSE